MANGRQLHLRITDAQSGQTVEQILRGHLALSTTCIRRAKLLPDGITLEGQRVFTNHHVMEGQLLSVRLTARVAEGEAVEGPLEIVYEDEDLLIINKPAGLMVHPRAGENRHTLVNRLLFHYQTLGLSAQVHLVNRLDRGTSGLMAVAKHPHAHARLISQLHSRAFVREYLAVCEGRPEPAQGALDFPIGRCENSALRRVVRSDGASARTHYRTVASDHRRSLLALRLESGRTHQIRVHLSHIGCPVTGDFLYGEEIPDLPDRFALHCAKLTLVHPLSGREIVCSAALPAQLQALISPKASNLSSGGLL